MRDYPHLAARLFGPPQLIHVAKLESWLPQIGAQILGLRPPLPAAYRDDDEARDRRPYAILGDGIAVISLFGTLVNRASGMDAMSGFTSYEQLRAELRQALADDAVKGILLDVDSYGGEGAGCFDLAREIAAARATKPLHAMIDAAGCSAAYALASGAERITMIRHGVTGSIGVIAIHGEQSRFNEKQGFTWTYVFAGARKADFNPDQPLAPEALAALRAVVDRSYADFVALIAANRPLSPEAVRATEARAYEEDEAMRLGLIDAVGRRDDALAGLAAAIEARGRAPSPLTIPGARVAAHSTMETTMANTDPGIAGAPPATPPNPTATPPAQAPALAAAPAGPPAEAPPGGAKAGNVVDLNAARDQGHAAGLAYAQEVMELCKIAGCPAAAADHIAAKTPVAELRKQLVNARAAESPEIDNKQASAVAGAANNYGWDQAFAKVAGLGFNARKGA